MFQTRVNNFLHASETMHMVARQGSDFGKVVTDILVANNAHTLDSWWKLVGVLGAWNNVIPVHVPYKPILRNCLPLLVVCVAIEIVAIGIVAIGIVTIGIVPGVVAIVVVVAVVAVHRSANIFFVGLVGKMEK
jgi:hypothetical protein